MRICHIATRLIRGGADENTVHTCNGQIAAGHQVHFVVGKEVDSRQVDMLRPEVKVWRATMLVREVSPYRDAIALFQIVSILRKIKPEAVHTHLSKAGILGRLAAFLTRTPIIVHGIHILPFVNVSRPEALVYRWLERAAASVTDVFVDVGEEMKRECLTAGIGNAKRHVVIASGMELERFSRRLHNQLDWHDLLNARDISVKNPTLVLLVSRLEARKGQFAFLPAFADLARADPAVVLVIAGEGPEHDRIASRIADLGLRGRVIMTGFRSDVERLMAVSHIGLLTSWREGLPRVLVQYALMGLPIVAADIPGAREIVAPGVNGFLSAPRDWRQMRIFVSQLLDDPETRQRFSAAHGQLDLSGWSVTAMNTKFEKLYQTLWQAARR